MSENNDYPFFEYFNRGKRMGLTDAQAHRWAITEDIYDAEDNLLGPDDPRPDGVCWHPPACIINLKPDYPNNAGPRECGVCGLLLKPKWIGGCWGTTKPPFPELIYWAPPYKLATRNETAKAVFGQLAAQSTGEPE